MRDAHPITAQLWEAARKDDWNQLFELAWHLPWGVGAVPEPTFALLLNALNDPEFVASNAARALLDTYQQLATGLGQYVERVPREQHDALIATMERAFPAASRSLRFQISVMLGEEFKDSASLGALTRLGNIDTPDAWLEVAHGLGHLATAADEDAIRNGALDALRDMLSRATPENAKQLRKYLRQAEARRVV